MKEICLAEMLAISSVAKLEDLLAAAMVLRSADLMVDE